MAKLTPKQVQQFSALEALANMLDANDLAAMGIDLTPTESGDCFGPFDLQQAWAELDTSGEWEADETNPADSRQPSSRTILDFPFFMTLLVVSGLSIHMRGVS